MPLNRPYVAGLPMMPSIIGAPKAREKLKGRQIVKSE